MHALLAQAGCVNPGLRPKPQRGWGWLTATPLVAVLCLATAPRAHAISFSDPEPNPFLSTNWTLSRNSAGTETADAEFSGSNLTFSTPALFTGEAIFSLTSKVTGQPYDISFDFDFTQDNPQLTASYLICTTLTCSTGSIIDDKPLGLTGEKNFTLESGQYLRFSISNNVEGGGILEISNFNATPVPSPLPFAGLGLAALGIYRARRRKAATPK